MVDILVHTATAACSEIKFNTDQLLQIREHSKIRDAVMILGGENGKSGDTLYPIAS
jgi:hypothetical protein